MMQRDLGRYVDGTLQVGEGTGFPLLDLHFHKLIWIFPQAMPPIEASPAEATISQD